MPRRRGTNHARTVTDTLMVREIAVTIGTGVASTALLTDTDEALLTDADVALEE